MGHSPQTSADTQELLRSAWVLIVPTDDKVRFHPLVSIELAKPNAPAHFSIPLGRYGGNDMRGFVMKGSDFERWAPTMRIEASGMMSPRHIRIYPLEGADIDAVLDVIKREVRESSPLRLAGDHQRFAAPAR